MQKVLLVAIGGGAGALVRYGTGLFAARVLGAGFAWGTLLVNLLGCLLIGASFELADRRGLMGPSARLLFVTGFLGAMTTFSTYALESANLAREGSTTSFVVNVLANNVGGLLMVLVGAWLVRHLT